MNVNPSKEILKMRTKLGKRLDEIGKKVTPDAVKKMFKKNKSWIGRHNNERIHVVKHKAEETQSPYVKNLFEKLKKD